LPRAQAGGTLLDTNKLRVSVVVFARLFGSQKPRSIDFERQVMEGGPPRSISIFASFVFLLLASFIVALFCSIQFAVIE
jgi:hypothetical protein